MLASLSLDGAWQLVWTDWQRGIRPNDIAGTGVAAHRCLTAQVPGEVHLDLLRVGLIGDPDTGLNALGARWVEEHIWTYRRTIAAPAAALTNRSWLAFDGLDHHAVIWLNGKEIARHADSFLPCRIEVTGFLVAGDNVLAVQLDSGLHAVGDKPGANFHAPDSVLHKRHWLRKPQSSFGWDWAPRLLNVGIHGSVRLEWTTAAVRAERFVPLATLSDDLSTGVVRGRWHVEGLAASSDVQVEMEVVETGQRGTTTATIEMGARSVECVISVPSPKLWWPIGHGAQPRYTVKAVMRCAGAVIATQTVMIGFRHVRIDQSPHPEGGRFFIVVVNGKRIFCKGGNWVPADVIPARLDRARYSELIERSIEANFNLLRIWGGGLYESDDFYDLCDQRGILVWQEFIFACSRYPGTDHDFNQTVQAEATYQVRRLASHPSLVVWCGNNEIEQGYWDWGYAKHNVMPCHQIFHNLLPRILAAEDGTRYYQPSSPYSPDHLHPTRDDVGDQHPWSVGFQNTDFRDYRKMICRFPNEGGILGPNSLPTVLECLPEGQRQVGSFAWQQHDNSINHWAPAGPTDRMITQWTGKDFNALSIPDAVYWGGLVQGEGLREYIDNFRRRMFDSSSAIFWMYNDVWPCTRSWTIVDHRRRRTPSFHPVRRAFDPVGVVVVENADTITIFGINETSAAISGDLRCGLFTIAGAYPLDRRATVTLPPNASTIIASFSRSTWTDPATQIAFAELRQGSRLLARNRLVLPFFKDLRWSPATVTVTVVQGIATFSSPTFAWGVCVDLDGETALADNFFDVYPDVPYAIPWTQPHAPQVRYVGNLA